MLRAASRPIRCSIWWIVFVLIVLPALFSRAASAQTLPNDTPSPATFRVAGVVVSASSGAPLGQTRVSLVSTKNPRDAASLITQQDGRFAFSGVPPGKYSLEGARRGYLPAAYDQHEQYSTAVVTGADFDTENLNLRLIPMAELAGSVLDENGQPIREAQVRLYAESHRGGTTRVIGASGSATDDQGTFEFTPLAPGKYFVSASATPWYALHVPAAQALAAEVSPALDVAYPTTFYGGATSSDGAQPITIAAGDRAQIEIRLTPVPALRFVLHTAENSGQGNPFPMLQQRVFDAVESVPMGVQQTGPGVVDVTGLPPGRYTVHLPNASGQFAPRGEIELRQDGQDLSTSSGEALGQVKLSVQLAKSEAVPKQLNIGLQDEKNTTVSVGMVNATGETTFDGVPAGKYSLRVFASDHAYSVTHMSSGDAQISGSQFVLRPGESQEWSVSLATGKSAIEGLVKRGDKPASGVMVVLIPKNPEANQDLFRRDQSDLDGSFMLPNVIPGLYTVAAIEDAWGFDWSQPLLLARYATHGQAVTVGELMQGAVTLTDPVQVQPR